MKKIQIPRILALIGVVLLLAQSGCLLIPDDKVEGERIANLRPSVRITGGAATPDPVGVDYKVQFFWSGSDADGVISFYQWAVDDTVSEGAWRDTTGFSARFNFKAARQVSGSTTLFTDWHTFYIRAIDNEYSFSKPVKRYFNARTIAPTSRITFPTDLESPAQLQRTVAVRWEGEDTDSSRPDHKPEYFEYKLVRLATIPDLERAYIDSLIRGENLLDSLGIGSKSKWIRVPRTTTQVTLRDLPADGLFAFGVRAVDEAGAIEPSLEVNRNYIAFAVTGAASQPIVRITELSLGTFSFPGDGSVWELSVPPGVPLRFSWVGDARDYGSLPGNVNYALDIPDPENESLRDPKGIGGWIGWGRWRNNQAPFTFSIEQGGTTHYLYVLMRDISDSRSSTRRCIIRMKVVPFTFSKTALVVDDARFGSGVYDEAHDAFLNRSILHRLRGFDNVNDYQIWRAFREGGTSPQVLRLEDVADYQTVVWSLNLGTSIHNGLGVARNEAVLSSFLKAGGRLFMFGQPIVGMNLNQVAYPRDPPESTTDKDRLYYKFLYMQNEIVAGILSTGETCYSAKSGLYVARSANPAYPDLFLDEQKWNPMLVQEGEYKGGIRWEGNMVWMNQVPAQYEGLDTLYTAQTWNRSIRSQCGTYPSPVEGAIIAARYESTAADTLEGRQHGRTLYFDFQPWWFQENRMMDAGTAAVNWLFTGRDQ